MVLPNDLNPYEYGSAPDGLYIFLYHGTAPYLDMDIDTSECVIDRLYMYDLTSDAVTEISDESVSAYTATKDTLYYITQAQVLYKTDYTGQTREQLYVCSQGTLKDLSSYLNTLYFIENDSEVIYLDTVTGQSQSVLQLDNLELVFLLSETELIATTEEGCSLYNFSTKETTLISELEAINEINKSVLRWNNMGEPDASVMAEFNPSSVTHSNDVSLPLTAYPADPYGNNGFYYGRPISWFHENGQEGCSNSNCKSYADTDECEGFARYAHDAYMHTVDNNIGYYAWLDENHSVLENHNFNNSRDTVKSFFNTLNTGAYVRYKTAGYYHSIVFVSRDNNGIWVYEGNQSYYENLTDEQKGNHPESYFDCGVHFQYYTYEAIAGNYLYAEHYVNHSFAAIPTCENGFYHKNICSSCDGYLQGRHTTSGATYSSYSSTQHKVNFTCCDGVAYLPHSYSNNRCTGCGRYNDLIQAGF